MRRGGAFPGRLSASLSQGHVPADGPPAGPRKLPPGGTCGEAFMLRCPACLRRGSKVLSGNDVDEFRKRRRKRKCDQCGAVWTTIEISEVRAPLFEKRAAAGTFEQAEAAT